MGPTAQAAGLLTAAEIQIHALTHLVMAPGEQVPVDIEGRLDLRVAHELLDRLGVGACVDQQRGKGVAALVEGDRPQRRCFGPLPLSFIGGPLIRDLPGALRSVVDRRRIERFLGRPANRRSSPERPLVSREPSR